MLHLALFRKFMQVCRSPCMTVVRDDEIIAPVLSVPLAPPAVVAPTGYYMPPGMPSYGPLYMSSGDPAMMAYAYHMGMPCVSPVQYDQTDVMSMIPTLRCWSCSKCGNLNYAHRLTCNLRKCQKMNEFHETPDWMCACGNTNYRFRKYCNLRKCQLPQIGNPFLFFGISQLIKSGYAPQTALSLLLTNTVGETPPEGEGCWQCVTCGNLNWPWRSECNRKGCTQTR